MLRTDEAMFAVLKAMVKLARRDLNHPRANVADDAERFLLWLVAWCGHEDRFDGDARQRLDAQRRRRVRDSSS